MQFVFTQKMRLIVVLAALATTACAMDSVAPSWPRLPLALLLRGEKPIYSNGDKIVGGAVVDPNSVPSQISLQRRSGNTFSQSCGGSILGASTILNAAHCVENVNNLSIFRVVAGEHSLSQDSGIEQIRNVVRYTMHENYNSRTFDNDIALIFLDAPLDLSTPQVQAMALPEENFEVPEGTMMYVTGWGTTSSGGSISDLLRGVEIPFVNDEVCNTANGGGVSDSMICAGIYPEGGVDSCQGDSGGPLFLSKTSNVQVGIVSWGYGCADPGFPGVYTEVSKFISWINTNNNA